MTEEKWRPVPGYEGNYEASSHGRVRSLTRTYAGRTQLLPGRVLKPQVAPNGYESVRLWRGGVGKQWRVHALILTTFVGPRPAGMFALHNDGDKGNNRVANLRWGTPSENNRDAVRHGANHYANRTHCPKGHPYDEANTSVRPNGTRACRACALAWYHARKQRVAVALGNAEGEQ